MSIFVRIAVSQKNTSAKYALSSIMLYFSLQSAINVASHLPATVKLLTVFNDSFMEDSPSKLKVFLSIFDQTLTAHTRVFVSKANENAKFV